MQMISDHCGSYNCSSHSCLGGIPARLFQKTSVCRLHSFLHCCYRLCLSGCFNRLYNLFYCESGSILTCFVTAHAIRNQKKVRQLSYCVLRRIHIILIHLTSPSNMCHGKRLHLPIPAFLTATSVHSMRNVSLTSPVIVICTDFSRCTLFYHTYCKRTSQLPI